jgi:hypothetical protein
MSLDARGRNHNSIRPVDSGIPEQLDESRRCHDSSNGRTLGRALADNAPVFAPLRGGEHIEPIEKLELKVLEQHQRLGSRDIE